MQFLSSTGINNAFLRESENLKWPREGQLCEWRQEGRQKIVRMATRKEAIISAIVLMAARGETRSNTPSGCIFNGAVRGGKMPLIKVSLLLSSYCLFFRPSV